jgi:hypothetical protein
MSGGPGTEQERRHEEPAVETTGSLTGDLEVDLDPEDVWTLGQLIEAEAVNLPPNVVDELMTGYRILQASGYEPPEDARTDVQLRGSGKASGIEVDLDDLDGADEVTARRVVLTEVTSEDARGDDREHTEPARGPAAGRDGGRPRAAATSLTPDAVPGPEDAQRLADAIETLADEVRELEVPEQADGTQPAPTSPQLVDARGALVLDWALIGLGLGVSTILVLAAAAITDPVFAILGIALLIMCVFQSVPYLVEDTEEGGGP